MDVALQLPSTAFIVLCSFTSTIGHRMQDSGDRPSGLRLLGNWQASYGGEGSIDSACNDGDPGDEWQASSGAEVENETAPGNTPVQRRPPKLAPKSKFAAKPPPEKDTGVGGNTYFLGVGN